MQSKFIKHIPPRLATLNYPFIVYSVQILKQMNNRYIFIQETDHLPYFCDECTMQG